MPSNVWQKTDVQNDYHLFIWGFKNFFPLWKTLENFMLVYIKEKKKKKSIYLFVDPKLLLLLL